MPKSAAEAAKEKAQEKSEAAAIIAEINQRLDRGDQRFNELEASLAANTLATQEIANNTAGMVRLSNELETGTRFLCRCAMGVRFVLKEVIEPFWKPTVLSLSLYFYITRDSGLPHWLLSLVHWAG